MKYFIYQMLAFFVCGAFFVPYVNSEVDSSAQNRRVVKCTTLAPEGELSVAVPTKCVKGVAITAEITFKNLGRKDVDYFIGQAFSLRMTDLAGLELPRRKPLDSAGHLGSVAPGKEIQETVDLRNQFELPDKGIVFLSVFRCVDDSDEDSPVIEVSHIRISIQ